MKEARNVVFRSPLSGRFYFARKARLVGGTTWQVVGPKYDITAQIDPYLLAKYRQPTTQPGAAAEETAP